MSAGEKSVRLFALDSLRGLDMLFLCVVQPIIMGVAHNFGFADTEAYPFMRMFQHYWGGFTAYDLIMPLFIFMGGAAVPLALKKRLDAEGRPTVAYWKHVVIRFATLWFLGMVAQGRLRSCDPGQFVYFSNTLQSIAVGYVVAALVFLLKSRTLQIGVTVALAAVYGLALQFFGDYSVSGNFAMKVDLAFVGLLQPSGHDTGCYTWYFTSLMFGVMALCGMHSTLILRSPCAPWRKAGTLAALGVLLFAGGLALERAGVPCIKQIYTVSFTGQAMGVSILLLASLYVVNDIWMCRRGWWVVQLFGQCALMAYMLGLIFRVVPDAASRAIFGELAKRIGGPWEDLVIQLGLAAVLTFALHLWREHKRSCTSVTVCGCERSL